MNRSEYWRKRFKLLEESLALLSLEKCFESFRNIYIGELGILFTP